MKRVLFFANKKLPIQDYRVYYALHTDWIDVCLAMPGKTEGLPERQYLPALFNEGVSFRDVPEFLRLFALLIRQRGRIAATHFFSTKLLLLGPILSRCAGIPSVITLTGFGRIFVEDKARYGVLRRVYFLFLGWSLRCCKLALFQNRGDMRFLAGRFPRRAGQFRHIGSAVAFEPVFRDRAETGPLTVLLVSRLHPSKGVNDFLDVAERMRASGLRFVLVGPPSRGSDRLLARVRDLAGRDAIEYRGELDGEELRKAYRSADILYFPSYGEGMPRVMIEAGMAGLCPVAYDIPANRDLIPDDAHGHLVAARDTEAVIRLLSLLDRDRESLRLKAKAYQKHILQNFSLDGYRARMDGYLRETIG